MFDLYRYRLIDQWILPALTYPDRNFLPYQEPQHAVWLSFDLSALLFEALRTP